MWNWVHSKGNLDVSKFNVTSFTIFAEVRYGTDLD